MQKSKVKSQNYFLTFARPSQPKRLLRRSRPFCILNFEFVRKLPGFTLLEMVVSLGIFTVVIVVSISILVALNNAQLKAGRLQVVQDTARYTMEEMTGRMRGGTNYTPDPPGCVAGACHNINFTLANGVTSFWYCWDQNTASIYTRYSPDNSLRCDNASSADIAASRITTPDITVSNLNFFVTPAMAGLQQAMITITMQTQASDPKLASLDTQMNLQATVTRRKRQ